MTYLYDEETINNHRLAADGDKKGEKKEKVNYGCKTSTSTRVQSQTQNRFALVRSIVLSS